jgi:hypothetical protein
VASPILSAPTITIVVSLGREIPTSISITHKSYHVAFSGPLSLAVEYQRPVIATNSGELGQFVKKYNIGNSYESDNWKSLIEVTNAFCHTNNRTYNFKLALEENSWENMTNKILSIGTST